MAKKKKEDTLSYLQMPLPEGVKYSKMTKVAFGGLNNRYTLDSGELSMESNISTKEYPYLTPSEMHRAIEFCLNDRTYYESDGTKIPISMFAFDDFLIVVYYEKVSGSTLKEYIKVDYVTQKAGNNGNRIVYTGILKEATTDNPITNDDIDQPRSVVQFNVYDGKTVVEGEFTKRLLIFPDQMSMYFDVTEDKKTAGTTFTLYDMNDSSKGIVVPPIKYATVHLSRLFGVSDGCVFASGFNDYTDWALDTTDDGLGDDGYDEKNAWMSQTQSNTKADGNFTGITTFQGHVVCFKRDFMHEIYNTKNPFRLVDIYPEGTIDNRTIQDVDGKLIFVQDVWIPRPVQRLLQRARLTLSALHVSSSLIPLGSPSLSRTDSRTSSLVSAVTAVASTSRPPRDITILRISQILWDSRVARLIPRPCSPRSTTFSPQRR